MNWNSLEYETPNQIKEICKVAAALSENLPRLNKYTVFDITGHNKKTDYKTVKSATELFYRCSEDMDRLINLFELSVVGNSYSLENIHLIKLTSQISSDEEGMKPTISKSDISKFIDKFKEDLFLKYNNIQKASDSLLSQQETGKAKFIRDIRLFMTFIYDVIYYSKLRLYQEYKITKYDERIQTKRAFIYGTIECLDKLDKACEIYLRRQKNIDIESRYNFEAIVVKTIAKLEKNKFLLNYIRRILVSKKYLYFYLTQVKSNSQVEYVEDKSRILNHLMKQLTTHLTEAREHINFDNLLNKYSTDELEILFTFPQKEHYTKFWQIYISAALQRGGIMFQSKEKDNMIKLT